MITNIMCIKYFVAPQFGYHNCSIIICIYNNNNIIIINKYLLDRFFEYLSLGKMYIQKKKKKNTKILLVSFITLVFFSQTSPIWSTWTQSKVLTFVYP